MGEHGIDIESQIEFGSSKTDLAVAQLLQCNCYAHKANISTFRHSKNRETPFPIFMGLSLYGKTRKRGLVELLHDHGLSIPYGRVLQISAQLGDGTVYRSLVRSHHLCASTVPTQCPACKVMGSVRRLWKVTHAEGPVARVGEEDRHRGSLRLGSKQTVW